MFQYFKMKKKELECKRILYTYAAALLHEKEDIIHLMTRLYHALKDLPEKALSENFFDEVIKATQKRKVEEPDKQKGNSIWPN